MLIKTSLGFSVEVDEDGRFDLPTRKFSTTELKKVVREVNRHLRNCAIEYDLNEVCGDD